jgi:hypothetical protein
VAGSEPEFKGENEFEWARRGVTVEMESEAGGIEGFEAESKEFTWSFLVFRLDFFFFEFLLTRVNSSSSKRFMRSPMEVFLSSVS